MSASGWRERAKALLGRRAVAAWRLRAKGLERPQWGNLRRTRPLSPSFGAERGLPIDRFYIQRFFAARREDLVGDGLEIQGTGYLDRFGDRLASRSSLDANPAHRPTYLIDLAEAERVLPAESFDCFLLPQTLQHVERLEDGIRQSYRLLRPGGTMLGSNACLCPTIPPDVYGEHWHLTPSGWRLLFARLLPGAAIEVAGHGNCLAVAAAALGVSADELSEAELLDHDPRFPVATTFRIRKPAGAPGSPSCDA